MKLSDLNLDTVMNITKNMALALMAFTLASGGCTSIQSKIIVQSPQGLIEMQLPKDAKFDVLSYSKSFMDTNGHLNTVTLTITNGDFRMNPAVIDAKTRHDMEMFKAGTQAALEGAAAAAGVPTLPK